jgi:hypothetical protein
MIVPPVPDYPTLQDSTSLRRQIRSVREALVRARHEIDNQIAGLDKLVGDLERKSQRPVPANLHESPPRNVHAADPCGPPKPLTIEYIDEPNSQIVMEATGPAAIEEHLEQATLEELNQALSKAFSQIANREGW